MDGDEGKHLRKFLADVKVKAKNGIVVNGVLTWVDIQSQTTAVGVRQEQMISLFTIEEIEEAIDDLWVAVGGETSILGIKAKRNNGPNKAKNLVDDLFKAFEKLSENNKKPVILATSVHMRTIRPYNLGDEANIHPGDIMERVKLLENCIYNQNKTIKNLVVKFENMEQNQAQAPGTTQTWPPLAAPGHAGQRVDGCHQQALGHRDVALCAESGQLHQNQTQTRVEQLISNAYNKV